MLIDWFTIFAQSLNFLILVWLMNRFLYKPILHAIDQREKRIAAELANADARKVEAERQRDEFERRNSEFDEQRTELFSKATSEARVERERLLEEARQAAAILSLKRQETLRSDEHNLHKAIRDRTQREVFSIARKALMDLAETRLEEQMVNIFVSQLRELNEEEKELLISALKASPSPVIVRTTFALLPPDRASTESAIQECLGVETQVEFETTSELISGIELSANGQKVAWSIADYLQSLERGVEELLGEKHGSEDKVQQPRAETTEQ